MSGNSESKKIAWIHTDLINNSASESVYNNVSDGMNTTIFVYYLGAEYLGFNCTKASTVM